MHKFWQLWQQQRTCWTGRQVQEFFPIFRFRWQCQGVHQLTCAHLVHPLPPPPPPPVILMVHSKRWGQKWNGRQCHISPSGRRDNCADYDNNYGLHRPHTQGPRQQDSSVQYLFRFRLCLLYPRAMTGSLATVNAIWTPLYSFCSTYHSITNSSDSDRNKVRQLICGRLICEK